MRIKRIEPQPELTALQRYQEARRDQEEATNRLNLAKRELIESLAAAGERTAEMRDGDKVYRATVYQSERVEIDEPGLKKAIGADAWRKVTDTTVTLNRSKLETALAVGDLTPEQVGLYLKPKLSTPAIRYTEGPYVEEVADE